MRDLAESERFQSADDLGRLEPRLPFFANGSRAPSRRRGKVAICPSKICFAWYIREDDLALGPEATDETQEPLSCGALNILRHAQCRAKRRAADVETGFDEPIGDRVLLKIKRDE